MSTRVTVVLPGIFAFSFHLSSLSTSRSLRYTSSFPGVGSYGPEIFGLFHSFAHEGISEVFLCIGRLRLKSGLSGQSAD